MRKIISLLSIVLMVNVIVSGCSMQNTQAVSQGGSPSGEGQSQSVPLNMESPAKDPHPIGPQRLNHQDFLEDYDFFWETVDENYPFYHVAQRLGFDLDKLQTEGRAKITVETTFPEFVGIMQETIGGFGATGHMQFLGSGEAYISCLEAYSTGWDGHMDYLAQVLRQPQTAASYEYLFPEVLETAQPFSGFDNTPQRETPENATMKILEENKVAYVKIPSFGWEYVERDGEKILPFLKSVEEYPHIILDIRGNGGGSDSYWNENLVPPLLSKPITVEVCLLFRDTAPIRGYIDTDGLYERSVPLEELGELPALPPEDRMELTHVFRSQSRISEEDLQSTYAGRIWLLVDEGVYSSAESFTMSCKASGFATIVGVNTGGDGAGIDPMIFSLPNTGLLWRNSIFYSINPDGSNNEEVGTTPDILIGENQDALEVCLGEIAKLSQ